MAVNFSQRIKNNVQYQKTEYIQNFFIESENELNSLGLPANVYFRDLYYDVGSNEIREITTNARVATLSSHMQFLYQPQGIQLYVLALDSSYYPI